MNQNNNFRGWSLVERALQEAKQERTPDLTLDLPHGQKIVIGRLSPDTILEIATWKGLGAPNENAVRLLLGATMPVQPIQTANVDSAQYTGELAAVVANTQSPISVEDHEVQEVAQYVRRSESVRSMRAMKKKHTFRNSLITFFSTIVLAAGAIFALAITNTLLFVHPQDGPELAVGNSATSIVAVAPASAIDVGDLAIIDLDGRTNLVRVQAINEDIYLLQTMQGQVQVERAKITGKANFIIPFIGAPWLLFHN